MGPNYSLCLCSWWFTITQVMSMANTVSSVCISADGLVNALIWVLAKNTLVFCGHKLGYMAVSSHLLVELQGARVEPVGRCL